MLVKFIYPVSGDLGISDSWPIRLGPYKVEWLTVDGAVTEVSASKRIDEQDTLPGWSGSGEARALSTGNYPSLSQLEHDLRLIQGAISLFALMNVNFDKQRIEWIPETEEEEATIQLYSISQTDVPPLEPLHLEYEYIAYAAATVDDIRELEIPLSFLRKGHDYVRQKRYFEAFYNSFFYFETQFCGGLSDPKKVKKALLCSQAVRDGLANLRESALSPDDVTYTGIAAKLKMSDEEIIGYLVDLRGKLHHHSKGRVFWHPDKSGEFRLDAHLLDALASRTALAQLEEVMFSPERNKQMVDAAKEFGSGTVISVAVDMQSPNGMKTHRIFLPEASSRITVPKIQKACSHLTRSIPDQFSNYFIQSFKLWNEDNSTIIAEYARSPHLATPSSLAADDAICINFRYTSRLRTDPLKNIPPDTSRLTREMDIFVQPSPDRQSLRGVRLDRILWQAEARFWDQATRVDVKSEILEWETRLAGRNGAVLSDFRICIQP
ncbi:hypothetical protein K7W03_26550 [Sphingobium sp. PNB]|uniref:hypothetical protein n=1 Tax=Sphingobium sp. PNB TaxID=863934 RepID=UPI001CA3A67D|nr:hypothetical protein [Sphingobium sp. PNB]MCB4863138.1 hypothetical protein [Sphingobium sp. PNB]